MTSSWGERVEFQFTPEEAWQVAEYTATHLRRRLYQVTVETPMRPEAPFRTTLLATRTDHPTFLVEAQGSAVMTDGLRDLARWLGAQREYCELHVATRDDTPLTLKLQGELRTEGVGLMAVSSTGSVSTLHAARNPALVATPDPGLRYWHNKSLARAIVERFNSGDRKDSLRDLCELVERETQLVLEKASEKGVINVTPSEIVGMQWGNQIEVLASPGRYSGGNSPILTSAQKDDYISFKGARNLLAHRVMTPQQKAWRKRQYVERIMQGTRLIAELSAIRRTVR